MEFYPPGLIAKTLLLTSITMVTSIQSSMDAMDTEIQDNEMMSEEKLLISRLMTRYDRVGRNGRPVINITDPINVRFGLGLIQMDLDERNKILKMSMWSKYKWTDSYLRWQPEHYGGLTRVRLAPHLIWIPDVMLYNTADPMDQTRSVLAVIDYNGTVRWVPHQIFKSSCSLDVTNYPFDRQDCNMWFGSWTYTHREVDIYMAFPEGIDLSTFQSDYKESSEWDIVNTIAEKKVLPSVNDSSSYAVLTFELHMKRRLVFSSYMLTLPCVFLACLTLVVFWLPPDRPDRTALAMSIFASFLLLLLILVEAAPPTASSVPLLGVYYCFNMVIIMLSVFLSSLVVNICRAGDTLRPVPQWLKKVALQWLARFLLMKRNHLPSHRSLESTESLLDGSHSTNITELHQTARRRSHKEATPNNILSPQYKSDFSYTVFTPIGGGKRPGGLNLHDLEEGDNDTQFHLEKQVREIRRSLLHMRSSIRDVATLAGSPPILPLEGPMRDWHDVALVMDRIFFMIYVVLIVVSLVVLFPRASQTS